MGHRPCTHRYCGSLDRHPVVRELLGGPATDQARVLQSDWMIFLYAGIGVALVVYGLIFFSLLRWRERRSPNAAQFHKNTPLELTYTAIPLLMVAGLFAFSSRNERYVEQLDPHPAVVVDVTGFDWSWRFHYQGSKKDVIGTPQAPPQLVMPANQTTQINLTTDDVNHSFWVPAFLFKRDAIGGVPNHFDVRPLRIGVYQGECGQYCGLEHTAMRFSVRVVDPAAFVRWASSP